MAVTAPILAFGYWGATLIEGVCWPFGSGAFCFNSQQLSCVGTLLLQILHSARVTDHMACAVQLELPAVTLVTHVYAPFESLRRCTLGVQLPRDSLGLGREAHEAACADPTLQTGDNDGEQGLRVDDLAEVAVGVIGCV